MSAGGRRALAPLAMLLEAAGALPTEGGGGLSPAQGAERGGSGELGAPPDGGGFFSSARDGGLCVQLAQHALLAARRRPVQSATGTTLTHKSYTSLTHALHKYDTSLTRPVLLPATLPCVSHCITDCVCVCVCVL